MDVGTFAVAAAIVLAGAIGVVVARNPVHAALMLVMTLFGVAVLFVLAAGHASWPPCRSSSTPVPSWCSSCSSSCSSASTVRRTSRPSRSAASDHWPSGSIALGTTGLLLLGQVSHWTTGGPARGRRPTPAQPNVNLLGKSVYTTYLFPFEATAALLIIAVVGAVVLARRPPATTDPAGRRIGP